jgi:hypothetical protein
MKIKLSGRTEESQSAIQALVNSLEKFGEVQEEKENIFKIDGREKLLIAFSSSSYHQKKGYYWFSLAKTKYQEMLKWDSNHAWLVMICEGQGNFFCSFRSNKVFAGKIPF